MVTEYTLPLWRARARHVGFRIWKGQNVDQLSEIEIQAAFIAMSREYGISYIWH